MKRAVVLQIESRIFLCGVFYSLLNSLIDMRRELGVVTHERANNRITKTKLHIFDLLIQFAHLRWKVHSLLNEQYFDRILKSTLTLRDKGFEVFRRKWIPKENILSSSRNEV